MIFALLLFLTLNLQAETPKELTVYTYASFTDGPGKKLKDHYERNQKLKIKYIAFDSAGTLLSRLRLEGNKTKADLVIGLDQFHEKEAIETGFFQDHSKEFDDIFKKLNQATLLNSKIFVPYDFGHFTVVQDTEKLKKKISSFDELLNDSTLNEKLLIEDPRFSTPGLGLLFYLKNLYKNDYENALKKLKPKVHLVAKGWSEAYGLFTKGEAPLVWSYVLSESYHIEKEKTSRFQSLIFKEGQMVQVELTAILKSSSQKKEAADFIKFLLSPEAQKMIVQKNWMLPAVEDLPKDTFYPSMLTLTKKITQSLKASSDDLKSSQDLIEKWTLVFSKK